MGINVYSFLGRDRSGKVPAIPSVDSNCTRRSVLKWSGATLLGVLAGPAMSQGAVDSRTRPSTSRASRHEAAAAIPFAQLAEPLRSKIQSVVQNPTVYRRLPVQVIACHPDLYIFLVRYPEVIVNMWHLMGVTKVEIDRTGQYEYRAKDGAGTVSDVQLVYGTREKNVFLAEGYYDGPLTPGRVTGRCVLLLSSAYSKDAKKQDYVSNRLDVFVQLDNTGVEVLAKTLHPFLGRTADSNFRESTRFLGQVSQVCESNGPGVQQLCARLTAVDPAVRDRFAQLATRVNEEAAMRQMAHETTSGATTRLSDRPQTPVDNLQSGTLK